MKCNECDAEFTDGQKLMEHIDNGHTVIMVRKDPLVLMLSLPDGSVPGRWETTEAFADGIAELYRRFPRKRFHLLPFTLQQGYNQETTCLVSIMAVEDPVI